MSANEIMGIVADWSAIPVALLGFGIAISQIMRTKRVAEAARDAANSAKVKMARSEALLILPKLHELERGIEAAVSQNQTSVLMTLLQDWRWSAGLLRKGMSDAGINDGGFFADIQASIASCSEAKAEIVRGYSSSCVYVTEDVREKIATVTERAVWILSGNNNLSSEETDV